MIERFGDTIYVEIKKIVDAYRKEDLLIQNNKDYFLLSKNFGAGYSLIESRSNAQRNNHPQSFDSIQKILNYFGFIGLTNKTQIVFVHPDGTKHIKA